jgi:Domain of unknown function (DUF5060)/Domain of unknown function (DUF5605)/Protein of unknown function (DUF4038)
MAFKHAHAGNPFTDIQLSARFSNGDTSFTVDGFYDGNDTFRIRFMPQMPGKWQYVTRSNTKTLHNTKGEFICLPAEGNNHGKVKVDKQFHFSYADGKQFYPVGTTAYAWNHMGKALQASTLDALKKSGFNKLRMCVFPKDYTLVKEDPEIFPFLTPTQSTGIQAKTQWDYNRFNPAFFKTLEQQLIELDKIGIEADLILFHPYDKGRWGFDAMPMDVNIRYLHYLIARLGAFKNIWWSVANEWDLVDFKTHADWLTLSKTVADKDPYRHLSSIHGSTAKYIEYWLPYFTHVSIQDEGPVMNWGGAVILRNIYGKPIIYDEVGYEGNLESRWGRYSGEEMNHLMWMGTIGGTYVTHGEAYLFKDATDTIFWAKGGQFKGSSWKRAGFLRKILEAAPGPLEASDVSRDLKTASSGKGHYLVYLGKEINDSWTFNLPLKNGSMGKPEKGNTYKVDIIDTWDMTITPYPTIFEAGTPSDYRIFDKEMKKIRLPLKPYLALRITAIDTF